MSLHDQAKEILDRLHAAYADDAEEPWATEGRKLDCKLYSIFEIDDYRDAPSCDHRSPFWAGHAVKRVIELGSGADKLAAAILDEMQYRGEIVAKKIGNSARWVHSDNYLADPRFHFEERDPDRLAELIDEAIKVQHAEYVENWKAHEKRTTQELLRECGGRLPFTCEDLFPEVGKKCLDRDAFVANVRQLAAEGRVVMEGDMVVEVQL